MQKLQHTYASSQGAVIHKPATLLRRSVKFCYRYSCSSCASSLTTMHRHLPSLYQQPTTKDGYRRHQHILSLQDVGNVHFLSVAVSLQSQTKTKRPSHQQSIYFSVCLSMAEPGGRNASRFLSRMMLWPSVRLRNRGAFLCLDLRQPPTDM